MVFLKKLYKNRSGFTLAEVLIVVAIMAILANFGFVAVSHYNKRMTLLEMDDTAKKIFLAAQNHLTIADSNGEWNQKKLAAGSAKLGQEYTIDSKTYEVIFGGKSEQAATKGVRVLMLPDQSVNLAGDGSYAIIFDQDTASIFGVYYSASSTFGNGQNDQFITTVDTDLKANATLRDIENRRGKTPLIGYYGNSQPGVKKEEGTEIKALEKIKVWFDNDKNSLRLNIWDPNNTKKNTESVDKELEKLTITIGGQSSNQPVSFSKEQLLEKYKAGSITIVRDDDGTTTTMICDSLTTPGLHFAELFSTLYPGENITATVQLKQNGYAEILYGSASANSLFEQTYESSDGYAARVSNIRHLENLSQEISGIKFHNAGEAGPSSQKFYVKKAILTKDIDLSKEKDGYGEVAIYACPLTDGSSKSEKLNGNENFIGVRIPSTVGLVSFEGNNKTISNLKVVGAPFDTASDQLGSGLFSTVDGKFSVSNLTIKNPIINGSENAYSGTLIGYFKGDSLSVNVDGLSAIKNNLSVQNVDVIGDASENSKGVSGNKSVGGLIGNLSHTDACRVQIRNTQISGIRVLVNAGNTGNAGGFIGEAADGSADKSTLTISQSKFTEPVKIEPNGNDDEKYDIFAPSGSAGGLIGTTGDKTNSTNWSITISDSEVHSDHRLNITGMNQVGGLIGGFYGDSLTITETLAAGKYMWVQTHFASFPKNDGSCVGGFVGEAKAKLKVKVNPFVTIQNCGAGAYVYAPSADCAGGLIGSLKGGDGSSIKFTYVSGHTFEGDYRDVEYSGLEVTSGGYNVYGCTATGGFIGYTNANNLTVENCSTAASAYTILNPEGTSQGIIGGFIGKTQRNKNITFKNCIAAGKAFTNGNNFTNFGGSFIGELHSTNANANHNSFENNYVLKGVDYNNKQTVGNLTITHIDADSNDMLQNQIIEVSTSELKDMVTNSNKSQRTSIYDDTLPATGYPYPLNALLPDFSNNKFESANSLRWYIGDWVEPKELPRSFNGDFGILYYEQVQHGDGANARTSYYYHGYVGYENNHIADGKKQYSQICTRDTLDNGVSPGPLDDNNALPVGHDEYVVEQGYMILVRKTFDTKYLKLDLLYKSTSNSSAQTLEQLIHQGIVAKEGKAEDGENGYYSNVMNFEGFDCYYIEPTQDLGALYPGNNKTQLRFVQTDNAGNCDWSKAATFAFNPMFSDISLMNGNIVPVSTIFKVRSAETLYNLFTTNYLTSAEWNGDYHVAINLDISFKNSINFKKFDKSTGKPIDLNLKNKDITLNELHLELYSELFQSLRYKLDYLTAPLMITNNNGNLHDMRISHYNPSESNISEPLLGSCSNTGEKINHILIENTTGPIIGTAKGMIENIEIQNMTIESKVDTRGLLIADVEDWNPNHKITNVTIDNLTVKSKGEIGQTGVSSGIVGIINNGRIQNLTINNVDIDENATFHGRQWGVVGEVGSSGSLTNLHMSNVNLCGSTSAIKEENKDNLNNKTNDIRIAVIGSSLGKVSKVEINNYQCPSDSFIIENGYNSVIDDVVMRNLVTKGNGFAGYSDGTIQNSYIINGSIGENGFIDNNAYNGKIINCQIYSDTSEVGKYTNNTYLYNVLGDKQGYELVRIGIDPFSNSREKRVAGFVYQNRGNVKKCSVTASIFGENMASGFIHEDKQQTIENCYANTIIDSYENGFGFCYRMINDNPTIQNCHSVGIINISDDPDTNDDLNNDNMIGSAGFIGDCDNNPVVKNSYSAIWSATRTTTIIENNQPKISITPLSTYYNFVRNAGGSTKNLIQNCSYLIYPGVAINNNDQKGTISGLKNISPSELKTKTEYGQIGNNETLQYKQYFKNLTADLKDAIYPYPSVTGLKAYGDWWEDSSQSVSEASDAKLNAFSMETFSQNAIESSIQDTTASDENISNYGVTESTIEAASPGYMTPAGILTETQPDLVTKKQIIRSAS